MPSRRVGATVGSLALLAGVIWFAAVHVTTEDSGSAPSEVKIASPDGAGVAIADGGDTGDGSETVSDARPADEDPDSDSDSDGDGDGDGYIRDLDLDDPATAAVARQEPPAAPTVAPTPESSANRTAPAPSASADD